MKAHRNVNYTPDASSTVLLKDSSNLFGICQVAVVGIDLYAL